MAAFRSSSVGAELENAPVGDPSAALGRQRRGPTLAAVWMALRLPILLGAVFLLRHDLLNAIERVFDIEGATHAVIGVASTLLSRTGLATAAFGTLMVLAGSTALLGPFAGYGLSILLAGIVGYVVSVWLVDDASVVWGIWLLLALNWAPGGVLHRAGLPTQRLARILVAVPALGETCLLARYFEELMARWNDRPSRHPERPRQWPGALLAALLFALALPGRGLYALEHQLRAGPDVRIVAAGDFNGLAFDRVRRRLLAAGHGSAQLLGFDVDHFDASPLASNVETHLAQGLHLDTAGREVYVYSGEPNEESPSPLWSEAILVLDADTLTLKRAIRAPSVSPGDAWIAHEPKTDTLLVSSEADEQRGRPLVVFDRESGTVLDERDEDAGNVLVHPEKSLVYLSFFRRVSKVLAYDVEKRAIVAEASTDPRMDRMAFDRKRERLLIASPAKSRVQVFDARTLTPLGAFPSVFGVREIAIDETRDRMLVASLASGTVALMRMDDHTIERTWYLGPWLRTIVLEPERGVAYVSSQMHLYELRYAQAR